MKPLFNITDVTTYTFPALSSGFGILVPLEFELLPFTPTRTFTVAEVPIGKERGIHAHHLCHQLLVALSGEVLVSVSDGESSREFLLDSPEKGLHIPPLIWASQKYLRSESLLYVLASQPYSRSDYIEDFEDFIAIRLSYPNQRPSA